MEVNEVLWIQQAEIKWRMRYICGVSQRQLLIFPLYLMRGKAEHSFFVQNTFFSLYIPRSYILRRISYFRPLGILGDGGIYEGLLKKKKTKFV